MKIGVTINLDNFENIKIEGSTETLCDRCRAERVMERAQTVFLEPKLTDVISFDSIFSIETRTADGRIVVVTESLIDGQLSFRYR